MLKTIQPIFLLLMMLRFGFAQDKNTTTMKIKAYQQEVQFLQLNNEIEIAFTDEGKGEVLLFIHGLASYLPAWNKNIAVPLHCNRFTRIWQIFKTECTYINGILCRNN